MCMISTYSYFISDKCKECVHKIVFAKGYRLILDYSLESKRTHGLARFFILRKTHTSENPDLSQWERELYMRSGCQFIGLQAFNRLPNFYCVIRI